MEGLMKGKRGLVMGVANDHSIAWGIARKLAEQGAELAFSYQGEAFGRRVKPLADQVGAKLVVSCDVEDSASVAATFKTLEEAWGGLDFIVHAIGFSDKNELKGLYADTSRENFIRTMVISCYSFTEVARHAAALIDLELPGGCVDPEDATPLLASRRELREETGYDSDEADYLGRFAANPALQTNYVHVTLLRNAVRIGEPAPEAGEEVAVELMSVEAVGRAAVSGAMANAMHIAAVFLVMGRLGKLQF